MIIVVLCGCEGRGFFRNIRIWLITAKDSYKQQAFKHKAKVSFSITKLLNRLKEDHCRVLLRFLKWNYNSNKALARRAEPKKVFWSQTIFTNINWKPFITSNCNLNRVLFVTTYPPEYNKDARTGSYPGREGATPLQGLGSSFISVRFC